ncbi:3-oxoacyl-[acyl-carrier-protein] reductase FabG [Serratia marcescens]|jgi:NAD(P)-dependent dehydrogenase (short-subunit alcohol dehydrogenase family)|uniref:Short-chain dehydrogenase n=1 Tax=Serratia marcescens TaxID=615 RepID=A0AAP8TR45_SERMA|nr:MULTISPECIES: SDR family oxidoreductase [Serratia]MBH2708511.1 SDR family oxidoreductase [Serratia marcescens]MBN5203410.1 SDR family oxidoreductase [Serratia marcescens]MBN5255314.1 SDR family oxidoreductase [Serratia marcescens]PNO70984.1 short-chain dehydrogenase [Serratia marcescens]CUY34653.1 3-oxoacyl-[acyl-carrier-protein] reductase FabG [Serratia marcescens]
MSRLQGKYALITGGTSGIGLETARQFIAEGATVAITGRSQSALDAAGQALAGKALLLLSDAGDIPQQRDLAQRLGQRWPRLDVLYINAGDVTHRPLQEWDEQSYQRLMDINLKGPFFLIQALLPLLANPSSVILCGSVSAHIGLPQSSAYAASKAGLLSLARTLSGELHARGIRVNGLSPGPTETPALGKLGLAEADEQALRDDIRALVPIGRMGSALELAKAAVFLAADESAFMVGAELQMDGGVGNL